MATPLAAAMTEHVDCVVIGAGVVGLAIGRALAQAGREVIVLEAAAAIGTGTSSRNSEVIHAGIYYATGSLKAKLCVTGRQALYAYCERRHVDHRRLGKIIIATVESQLPELRKYAEQAAANGLLDLRSLTAAEIEQLEPSVRCVGGLESPSTGIVDSHSLMQAYQADLEAKNGVVLVNVPVLGGALHRHHVELQTSDTVLRARAVVNAAGLNAQEVSRTLHGVPSQSVPERYLAKGHYFTLRGRSPFKRLVYPIADAAGLGIHVTLDMSGRARFGPDVQWIDSISYDFDRSRHAAFCDAIRSYYPALDAARLEPGYVGIRPKVVGRGQAAADFCVCGPADHEGASYVALYGIESPGLTASLALGEHVSQLLLQR
jgi:L-2-hydroxyglutarate oxidase LhgO